MVSPRHALRYPSLAALVTIFHCLDESWLRKRVWGSMQAFAAVFVVVMPGRAMSYQGACSTLFDWAGMRFGWGATPDPSGMQRARMRLTSAECQRVWELAKSWAQTHLKPGRELVSGRCVVGIDGSILHLPRSASMRRSFPVMTDRFGLEQSHYPQGLFVSAWDLMRRMPLAWTLSSLRVGERDGLRKLLPELPERAILVLDRGYPARDLLGEIVTSGRDFVVRMVSAEAGSWDVVAEFLASGARSAVVDILLGAGAGSRVVRARLVLRCFDRGRPRAHQRRETMVIMTSLTDPSLSGDDLCDLYGARWGIETLYRELKALANVEGWHGTTPALIAQEITALMCWFAISAVMAQTAEGHDRAADGAHRRANTRRVFDAVAYAVEALLMASFESGRVHELLIARANEAIRRLERWKQKIRPGRSAPRKPLHPYARSLAKS